MGGQKCGCGVVQLADGYSGKRVWQITFVASAAGSGSDSGNGNRVLRTSKAPETEPNLDSAGTARGDHSVSGA